MITVEKWISYEEADGKPESCGGLGGWFGRDYETGEWRKKNGHRWADYIRRMGEAELPYLEAIRKDVVERKVRYNGRDHQNEDDGVPMFSDGSVGTFSYRAWGDLMAAIWSTEENKDYCYMDFYC